MLLCVIQRYIFLPKNQLFQCNWVEIALSINNNSKSLASQFSAHHLKISLHESIFLNMPCVLLLKDFSYYVAAKEATMSN